jgi:signal transduction histidine kinase
MKLRNRIVFSLLAITLVLAAPAVVGLLALRELQGIAAQLKVRDTGATATLGRVHTGLEELDYAHSNYLVLSVTAPDTALYWLAQTDSAMARVEAELGTLRRRPRASQAYRAAAASAAVRFDQLRRVLYEGRRRAQGGGDPQSAFQNSTVVPALNAMDRALEPVAAAIEQEGRDKVEQAQRLAERAAATTLAALAVALGLTLLIGAGLTGALLRPIQTLKTGMAQVAAGDFTPDVTAPARRPDEIGDLARSFRAMADQLAELERLRAEFVSVASHEIKTPLSVIRGYVSLLADGIYGGVSEQQLRTLGAVTDQTDRLTRLVHRLLDISRFEAGGGRLELRRLNVRDFLEELTDDFRVLAMQNGVDFTVEVADDAPTTIEADPDRLNEVLGNLLSNAFKFTRRDGRIQLSARREGPGLQVTVADTGVGIPPDKLPRIFEKFYQVDNEAQPRSAGSGLGLAIAREIVEAHGGTISAESQVSRGTTFRVYLPERPTAPHAGAT